MCLLEDWAPEYILPPHQLRQSSRLRAKCMAEEEPARPPCLSEASCEC